MKPADSSGRRHCTNHARLVQRSPPLRCCVLTGEGPPPCQNTPISTLCHCLRALIRSQTASRFPTCMFDKSWPNIRLLSDRSTHGQNVCRFFLNRQKSSNILPVCTGLNIGAYRQHKSLNFSNVVNFKKPFKLSHVHFKFLSSWFVQTGTSMMTQFLQIWICKNSEWPNARVCPRNKCKCYQKHPTH